MTVSLKESNKHALEGDVTNIIFACFAKSHLSHDVTLTYFSFALLRQNPTSTPSHSPSVSPSSSPSKVCHLYCQWCIKLQIPFYNVSPSKKILSTFHSIKQKPSISPIISPSSSPVSSFDRSLFDSFTKARFSEKRWPFAVCNCYLLYSSPLSLFSIRLFSIHRHLAQVPLQAIIQ